MSLPVRGAWIEMLNARPFVMYGTSLPVRGAWIEIDANKEAQYYYMSLPVRGAWIEIRWFRRGILIFGVAPRAGSVD